MSAPCFDFFDWGWEPPRRYKPPPPKLSPRSPRPIYIVYPAQAIAYAGPAQAISYAGPPLPRPQVNYNSFVKAFNIKYIINKSNH